jgi:hypothetical protein
MKKGIFLAVLPLMLAGCAATSSIMVGTPRPAIAPDQVRIYLTPPARYEEIAVVDASSRSSWAIGDQAKMDVVVKRMKEEAAKLGANGILLRSSGDRHAGSVGAVSGVGSPSLLASESVFEKAGSGIAIYVPN